MIRRPGRPAGGLRGARERHRRKVVRRPFPRLRFQRWAEAETQRHPPERRRRRVRRSRAFPGLRFQRWAEAETQRRPPERRRRRVRRSRAFPAEPGTSATRWLGMGGRSPRVDGAVRDSLARAGWASGEGHSAVAKRTMDASDRLARSVAFWGEVTTLGPRIHLSPDPGDGRLHVRTHRLASSLTGERPPGWADFQTETLPELPPCGLPPAPKNCHGDAA